MRGCRATTTRMLRLIHSRPICGHREFGLAAYPGGARRRRRRAASPWRAVARPRAHRALGLQVYSRVDVLLPENGPPTLLEANTIPGMTEASLLPEAAAAAGIDYVDLCLRIIELSRARRGRSAK